VDISTGYYFPNLVTAPCFIRVLDFIEENPPFNENGPTLIECGWLRCNFGVNNLYCGCAVG
jgi:hypothetical protein